MRVITLYSLTCVCLSCYYSSPERVSTPRFDTVLLYLAAQYLRLAQLLLLSLIGL